MYFNVSLNSDKFDKLHWRDMKTQQSGPNLKFDFLANTRYNQFIQNLFMLTIHNNSKYKDLIKYPLLPWTSTFERRKWVFLLLWIFFIPLYYNHFFLWYGTLGDKNTDDKVSRRSKRRQRISEVTLTYKTSYHRAFTRTVIRHLTVRYETGNVKP